MRIAAILFIICLSFSAQSQAAESQPTSYAGSFSCREELLFEIDAEAVVKTSGKGRS